MNSTPWHDCLRSYVLDEEYLKLLLQNAGPILLPSVQEPYRLPYFMFSIARRAFGGLETRVTIERARASTRLANFLWSEAFSDIGSDLKPRSRVNRVRYRLIYEELVVGASTILIMDEDTAMDYLDLRYDENSIIKLSSVYFCILRLSNIPLVLSRILRGDLNLIVYFYSEAPVKDKASIWPLELRLYQELCDDHLIQFLSRPSSDCSIPDALFMSSASVENMNHRIVENLNISTGIQLARPLANSENHRYQAFNVSALSFIRLLRMQSRLNCNRFGIKVPLIEPNPCDIAEEIAENLSNIVSDMGNVHLLKSLDALSEKYRLMAISHFSSIGTVKNRGLRLSNSPRLRGFLGPDYVDRLYLYSVLRRCVSFLIRTRDVQQDIVTNLAIPRIKKRSRNLECQSMIEGNEDSDTGHSFRGRIIDDSYLNKELQMLLAPPPCFDIRFGRVKVSHGIVVDVIDPQEPDKAKQILFSEVLPERTAEFIQLLISRSIEQQQYYSVADLYLCGKPYLDFERHFVQWLICPSIRAGASRVHKRLPMPNWRFWSRVIVKGRNSMGHTGYLYNNHISFEDLLFSFDMDEETASASKMRDHGRLRTPQMV